MRSASRPRRLPAGVRAAQQPGPAPVAAPGRNRRPGPGATSVPGWVAARAAARATGRARWVRNGPAASVSVDQARARRRPRGATPRWPRHTRVRTGGTRRRRTGRAPGRNVGPGCCPGTRSVRRPRPRRWSAPRPGCANGAGPRSAAAGRWGGSCRGPGQVPTTTSQPVSRSSSHRGSRQRADRGGRADAVGDVVGADHDVGQRGPVREHPRDLLVQVGRHRADHGHADDVDRAARPARTGPGPVPRRGSPRRRAGRSPRPRSRPARRPAAGSARLQVRARPRCRRPPGAASRPGGCVAGPAWSRRR